MHAHMVARPIYAEPMSSQILWAAGRYESLSEQIASIATQTVAAADRRHQLREATVVDLACGTGSATLAAADLGAQVTGVDLTPELIVIGARKALATGHPVSWVTADAADTGLPGDSADAILSNMGIIFVEPERQVAEITRLLKSDGVLSFSSWVRSDSNPLFDPVVAVLGAPPASTFTPDQWGDPEIIDARLTPHFSDIEIENANLTWTFTSMPAALHFLASESPTHVSIFGRADESQREQLLEAFEAALRPHLSDDGIAFDSPYAVVSAIRR